MTSEKHNPENKECPQNKECTSECRATGCTLCICPQPERAKVSGEEELKLKFNDMWDKGDFSWNGDRKQPINPDRMWNVYIRPVLRQQRIEWLEAEIARVDGMKKDIKGLFPEATMNPLDEETAFQIQGKNFYNKSLDDLFHSLQEEVAKLKEV